MSMKPVDAYHATCPTCQAQVDIKPGVPTWSMSASDRDELVESLAALEHAQWAQWTAHFLQVLDLDRNDGDLHSNKLWLTEAQIEAIRRWRRQIQAPYEALTDPEKDADRDWAHKMLVAALPSPGGSAEGEVLGLPPGAIPVYETGAMDHAIVADEHGNFLQFTDRMERLYLPLIGFDDTVEGAVAARKVLHRFLRNIQLKVQHLRHIFSEEFNRPGRLRIVVRTPPWVQETSEGWALGCNLGFLAYDLKGEARIWCQTFPFERFEEMTHPEGVDLAEDGSNALAWMDAALKYTLAELYPTPSA